MGEVFLLRRCHFEAEMVRNTCIGFHIEYSLSDISAVAQLQSRV